MGPFIQKHQRHDTLDAKTPPRRGPAMDARPKVAPMNPMYLGLFSSGKRSERMTFPPVLLPALPMPAMARPMMKAVDEGAAAQMMDPISKMKMSVMKTHLAGK